MGEQTNRTGRGEKIGIWRGAVTAVSLFLLTAILTTSAGAEDLMHNSAATGSNRWQANGGWGVSPLISPNSKYGEFTCATCHEPNSRQIKNIRSVISSMNGDLLPNGATSVNVAFKNVTSMGDDSSAHLSSNRICEVCHSQLKFHNADSGKNSGGLGHPNPKAKCTSCHAHNTGFKASCGGCHGNPPTTATLGAPTGYISNPRPSNATDMTTPGAHEKHTSQTTGRGMVCDTCHYISNGGVKMPSLSNTIQMGFFGFGGKVTSGTYVPYSSSATGYKFASGTPNTTIAEVVTDYAVANRCANVYCHGGGVITGGTQVKPPLTGGLNTTPIWTAAGQSSCNSCHGGDASHPPTMGSHTRHASSVDAGSYGAYIGCIACHPAANDNAHVQGSVRWGMNASDTRIGAAATYRGVQSGTTGELAPSSTYGQCANLYCHSQGESTTGFTAPNVAPTWGDSSGFAGCVGCHGNNAGATFTITGKGHKAHVKNESARFNGFDFKCNECHNATVDSTDQGIINIGSHVNGIKDVAWGAKSTGGLAYASNGCTQIYCHSNGQSVYKAPPLTWNNIPDNQEGTINCDYCHGGIPGNATPVSSNRHTNHINAGPLPHKPADCNDCHSNTVGPDGKSIYSGANSMHINRSINVSFLKMGNFSGSWTKSTNRCTATWCHANSNQVWTTTTLNTCGSCHAATNTTSTTAKLSDAHRKHYNSGTAPTNSTEAGWANSNNSTTTANVFMCGSCHPGTPTTSHINGPAAVNGSAAEVAIRLPFTVQNPAYNRPNTIVRGTGTTNTDGRGYIYSSGTTCDTYCHSNGKGGAPLNTSFNWSVSTLACGACHNKAGDANPMWSGAHSKHLSTTITSNLTCNACHAATASSNTTVSDRRKHPNGFINVTGNSTAGPFRWDGTSCSNIRCHGVTNTQVWTGGPLPGGCVACHGNNAGATFTITGKGHKAHVKNESARFNGFDFKCNECHNLTVDSTDTTVISTTQHINGTNNVDWGAKSTGGLAYASNGCTQIYCHSNGQSVYKAPPLTWNNIPDNQEGTINCDYCHGGILGNATPVSSNRHTNHINAGPLPHKPADCNDCHSNTVGPDGKSIYSGANSMHINRSINVSFLKMGNFSGSWTKSTNRCTATWCHANTTQTWTTTTLNTCGSCHAATNTTTASAKLSDAHRKHYNSGTAPANSTEAGWANSNNSTTTANVFMCGSCHPGTPATSHINGPAAVNGSAAEVAIRLPFTVQNPAYNRPNTIVRGTGTTNTDGRGYIYSSGTTCDTYCHSNGKGGTPLNTSFNWSVSTLACGACHNRAGDASPTWSAPHTKHINVYSVNTNFTCNLCHSKTASNNTTVSDRRMHPNGFVNVTSSSYAPFSWTGTQCVNNLCHSDGKATPSYVAQSWNTTVTCTSCHGGAGVNNPNNVALSVPHNKHINSTTSYSFMCASCHYKTASAADNAKLKDYSGVKYHNNKTRNVVISAAYGGSWNGTQCSNVYCHSNVQGANGSGVPTSYKTTPAWGNAAALDCSACHADMTSSGSGTHLKHTANYVCATCHSTAGSGTAKHVDGFIDVTFSGAGAGTTYTQPRSAAGSDGYGTCSNIACHYNGSATWGNGALGCVICHPLATLQASGAHGKHISSVPTLYNYTANRSTAGAYDFGCSNCHPLDPLNNHANGSVNVTLNSTNTGGGGNVGSLRARNSATADGLAATNGPSGVYGTTKVSVRCTAAYCHSNGYAANLKYMITPDWYGPAYTGDKCAMCHGNSPNANDPLNQPGSPAHYSKNFLGFANVSGGHVRGIHTKQIFTGTVGLAPAGNTATGSHGNAGTSTTINCNICHNKTVTSSANDKNIACVACHTALPKNPADLIADKRFHVSGNVDVSFASIRVKSKAQLRSGSYDAAIWSRQAGYKVSGAYDTAFKTFTTATQWDGVTKTCSNISCHNGKTVKWGDTGGTTSCASCHSSL